MTDRMKLQLQIYTNVKNCCLQKQYFSWERQKFTKLQQRYKVKKMMKM